MAFWRRNRNKCRRCGADLALHALPPFSGSDGEVNVTVSDLPAMSCPTGCTKRYPYSDFGNDFITRVLDGKTLSLTEYTDQAGVRDWVLTKPPVCSYCDGNSGTLQRNSWEVSGSFTLRD